MKISHHFFRVGVNAFYNMLMEDTPGYVPSKHWFKPPIQESSRVMSKRDNRSKSSSRSSQSPECTPKSPIMNQESRNSRELSSVMNQESRNSRESSSVMNQESSSSRESSSVMKHVSSSSREPPAVMKETSSNSKNSSSFKENVMFFLRERNAASCAKFDAAKLHGPRDGQDCR